MYDFLFNNNFFNYVFYGNKLIDYLLVIFLFGISVVLLKIFKIITIKSIKKVFGSLGEEFSEFIKIRIKRRIVPLLYLIVFLSLVKTLDFPSKVDRIIDIIWMSLFTVFGIVSIISLLEIIINKLLYEKGKDESMPQLLKSIMPAIKISIWVVGIIFLLSNLGLNISTIVAALGIGGIAVALGAQSILGDLFSYIVIIIDKPFEIGDYIVIDDMMGNVEHIGIKTTRIVSLWGEQLVVSNSDITKSRLKNYKKMEMRRVLFRFGLVYNTEADKLKQIPDLIKNIIENIEETKFDRCHFFSFDKSDLTFEVVYYVNGNDYNKYMDIQQEVNLSIKEKFDKENIYFAYPTQTVFIKNELDKTS
ncbi:MAG: hypothetical protein A2475_03090 [Ignavibacteria bacterium RIFOXYC2_FULL_35_21]|nr:MAG: hypothetical protein A2220_03905 [Ignavibacteria bacterium RIFOXYA2_FULL_35_10]OGV23638.1 MAG: hypothetical protein A2475_03090 [Ignavibacteria bacterium RIFOXYC2_FULL_35_21]